MNNYIFHKAVVSLAIIMACSYSSIAFCLTPEEIKKLRQETKAAASHSQIGAIYGHIISFVSVPDISASNLEIDTGVDTETLDVFKVPLHYKLETNSDSWDMTLRGSLNYASFKDNDAVLTVPEGEKISSEWETYSASVGTMAEFPLDAGFSFALAGDLGIARFDNKADYKGTFVNSTLKPVLDGILFDWETNASYINAMLGLYYEHVVNQYEIDIKARYSHTYIDSFGESKDFPGFTENTDPLTINTEFGHPLGLSLSGQPLSGVLHLDHTTFIGPDRDLAGFSYLSGIGLSIKADVSEKDWYVESLQFGAKYLTGDNVRGWSLIFGYRF